MGAVDADAHVLECPDTWRYLEGDDKRFMPMIVNQTFGNELRANDGSVRSEYWLVDQRIHAKDSNVDNADTTKESREMADVSARLHHMDELGIEIQVLYPTLFLRPVTTSFQSELALCRSYNRWLADIWKQGKGRLRWVAMPPLSSMGKVRDELAFAKEHGACGIFMRGLECELPISAPYFHPLYEIAAEMDLPVCIHSANGSILHHDFFAADTTFTKFKLAVVGAFHSLIEKGVPSMFPEVRWGFVEVSAQWLPYVFNDLWDRFRRAGKPFFDNPLAENNMYVACEVTDDLAHVLEHASADHLMIGTDYGHYDPSAEINAINLLRQDKRAPAETIAKILEANPKRFYGLT